MSVAANASQEHQQFADLVRENSDSLVTFAANLVGNAKDGADFVAAGIRHAQKFPPLRMQQDGAPVLYRAVLRACRQRQRYPEPPKRLARLFGRNKTAVGLKVDASDAMKMSTQKRALATLDFNQRAALLLVDLAHFTYEQAAIPMQCSPQEFARQIAASRRELSIAIREISI
jgi:RNA polymerase sigma-70 factor (ECF subfamily)